MKIEIKNDVFDVANRVKVIDESYYILYNTNSNKYELHSSKYGNSYLFSLGAKLDAGSIKLIQKALRSKVDLEKIEQENNAIERKHIEKSKDENSYKIQKIIDYSNKKSTNIDDEIFKNKWI